MRDRSEPTLRAASVAPPQLQKLQFAGGRGPPSPPPEPPLTAAWLFSCKKIRQSGWPGSASLLSGREVCAPPCQAPLPIREVRLQPPGGRRPASSPPGPLPGHRGLIVTGARPRGSPSAGPAAAPREGSALCPGEFQTVWTEGGSPMFTVLWLSPCPGQLPGDDAPQRGLAGGRVRPRAELQCVGPDRTVSTLRPVLRISYLETEDGS